MRNSSSQNYSEKFKHIKKHQEKNKINFESLNDEIYNNPFKLSELTDAIKISNDTATGPDEIYYQMLKHLPENALVTILQIFNDIWTTGVFPDWLVGCFGFNCPLRQYFSLYRAVSQREGERGKKG